MDTNVWDSIYNRKYVIGVPAGQLDDPSYLEQRALYLAEEQKVWAQFRADLLAETAPDGDPVYERMYTYVYDKYWTFGFPKVYREYQSIVQYLSVRP